MPQPKRVSVQLRQVANRFRRLSVESLEKRTLLTIVTSVQPPANSFSAPASTNLAATFDRDITAATAAPQSFAVHSMQRGQLVSGVAQLSTAGATVTLDPTSDFLPGELPLRRVPLGASVCSPSALNCIFQGARP